MEEVEDNRLNEIYNSIIRDNTHKEYNNTICKMCNSEIEEQCMEEHFHNKHENLFDEVKIFYLNIKSLENNAKNKKSGCSDYLEYLKGL